MIFEYMSSLGIDQFPKNDMKNGSKYQKNGEISIILWIYQNLILISLKYLVFKKERHSFQVVPLDGKPSG